MCLVPGGRLDLGERALCAPRHVYVHVRVCAPYMHLYALYVHLYALYVHLNALRVRVDALHVRKCAGLPRRSSHTVWYFFPPLVLQLMRGVQDALATSRPGRYVCTLVTTCACARALSSEITGSKDVENDDFENYSCAPRKTCARGLKALWRLCGFLPPKAPSSA